MESGSRLLSISDLDPERWKPMGYSETVDVPVAANGVARVTINTVNQAYIMTRIGHSVLGNTVDWQTTGLINDGQYLIHWVDEARQYISNPTQANLLWGPHIEGPQRNLEYPIYYAGNHAISFDITNLYQRILTPESETFQIQIHLSGLADFGQLQAPI